MLRITPRVFSVTSSVSKQAIRVPAVFSRRLYSTEPLPTPGNNNTVNPKIANIVNQIESLTLLQTSELVSQLKTRLNIQDIAMPVGVPLAAAPTGATAAAEEEKPAEKTEFNLKIEKVDATSKAKVIREVKNLAGLNLVEAKKFVESVPKVLKESVNKEEAEKLKKALEAVGATVILE
ncbi:unnamed protein product [Cunninghamella echinulata]